jgi:hypothetical protein
MAPRKIEDRLHEPLFIGALLGPVALRRAVLLDHLASTPLGDSEDRGKVASSVPLAFRA